MTDWPDILAQHGGIVWKNVRRIVGNDDDARDCFQETFVAAWEYAREHDVRNWPGLLKRLATLRALDHLRARMRTANVLLSDQRTLESACSPRTPSAIAEDHELFDRLRRALAMMPADQAQACCLRHLEMLSYEEISEQLGITVNHAGVLLHRARAALRVQLAEFRPMIHSNAGDQR